jgi:hypothetical protein
MKTCVCGCSVDADGKLCLRCAALRILELDSDATETEIRASYLTLVKVWHSDRFENEEHLKEAAEAKLKDINSAYEFLTLTVSEREQWEAPSHWAQQAADLGTSSDPESFVADNKEPFFKPLRSIFPAFKFLFNFAVVVFVVLLCRYLWIALNVEPPPNQQVAGANDYTKEDLLKELEGPKKRFLEAVKQDLHTLNLRKTATTVTVTPQTAELAPVVEVQPRQKPIEKVALQEPAKILPEPRTIESYITVGSTKDEVLEQQGPPTESSENKFVYGRSEIYFKDNIVTSWNIDVDSNPIRVKLWPESAVDPSIDSFTYGSSKDVVLTVQGTPTSFSEDKFMYGGSEVSFQNHRVVRWKNDPGSIPLRVRLP